MPAALPDYFTNKKNIEVFADKLGKFHDLCIALYFFEPIYINKVTDEKEKQILLTLRQKLEESKDKIKEDISTLLHHVKQEME